MTRYSVLVIAGIILSFAVFVAANIKSESRCFEFTWLGPEYTNTSTFLDNTCNEATKQAKGVPCKKPLVVSIDGTFPNVTYLWQKHSNASCALASNKVCAKYTYSFNGQVENSTHLCTTAVDMFGNAITNGCYKQINGSYTKEVCFCRSIPGEMPCNGSVMLEINYLSFSLISIAFILI